MVAGVLLGEGRFLIWALEIDITLGSAAPASSEPLGHRDDSASQSKPAVWALLRAKGLEGKLTRTEHFVIPASLSASRHSPTVSSSLEKHSSDVA